MAPWGVERVYSKVALSTLRTLICPKASAMSVDLTSGWQQNAISPNVRFGGSLKMSETLHCIALQAYTLAWWLSIKKSNLYFKKIETGEKPITYSFRNEDEPLPIFFLSQIYSCHLLFYASLALQTERVGVLEWVNEA